MDLLNRRRFLRAASGLFVPALMLRSKADTILSGPVMRPMASGAVTIPTPTCFWTMNESSAGSSPVSRLDSVGGQNLTDNINASSATGKISNAVALVSARYLSHADSATLSTGDIDFTFGAWVYIISKYAATANTILGKWDNSTNLREYFLYYDGIAERFKFAVSIDGAGGGSIVTVVADNFGSASLNTWYLVFAWHLNGVELGIQVMNSGAANTISHTGGCNDSTASFAFGSILNPTATSPIEGRIDDTGFWKSGLSAAQRDYIWNSGNGRTSPYW